LGYVWPRPPFLRRQRDQDRVRDSARTAVAEFPAELERGPTDPLPVVRFDPKDRQRSLDVMRWGLIPYWAKDIKIGFSTFNARAEEIDTKPAYREAFRQRRCLVPLNNFYEWQKTATGKQPYAIGLKRGGLMAMAGLWETWRSPAGERIRSFTIATMAPNDLCARLHNRMSVMLKPESWPQWLGEQPADVQHLKALLAPPTHPTA
jgi:putative SOS response-associated peptidase YedK